MSEGPLEDVVTRALDAFGALTTAELDTASRAQRLRVEVLLPLARSFADALDDRPEPHTRTSEPPARTAQAALVGARACLVIMSAGRATLHDDLLREVTRLGVAFCALNISALDALGTPGPHEAARLSASLRVIARERSQASAPPPPLAELREVASQGPSAEGARPWPAPRDRARFAASLVLTVTALVGALLWGVRTARVAIAAHRAQAPSSQSARGEAVDEQR